MAVARQHAVGLVTTEKDAARLLGEAGALEELARQSRPVPVRLQFSVSEAERLKALVDQALSAR